MKFDLLKLIKYTRLALNENQKEFGKRFGSTANTVSRWESGYYEPPLKVIEFVLNQEVRTTICPLCKGEGTMTF